MRASVRHTLIAVIALAAVGPGPGRATTAAPGQRNFEVFSCRFKGGGGAKLVLTRSSLRVWRTNLVQTEPNQTRTLLSIRVYYGAMAHGGWSVVEAHSGGSTLHLFEQQGGVEESFGALTESSGEGTATRFCIPDSVETETWLDRTLPSQLVSLTDLQRLGVAVDLPHPPDFPQERQSTAKPRAR
jgi:hypothetical protein